MKILLAGGAAAAFLLLGGHHADQVRWGDRTYPTRFPLVGPHGPIAVHVHGGVGHVTVRPANVRTRVTIRTVLARTVAVTGGHDKDELVWLSASYGGGRTDSEVQVWSGTSGRPRLLGRLHAPSNAQVGLPPGDRLPYLYHVWTGSGDVWADAAFHVGRDRRARDGVVRWHWTGTRFVPIAPRLSKPTPRARIPRHG